MPVIELFRVLPSVTAGRWIAVFNFFYGMQEFEYPYFGPELNTAEGIPDATAERRAVLEKAYARFLNDVALGGLPN